MAKTHQISVSWRRGTGRDKILTDAIRSAGVAALVHCGVRSLCAVSVIVCAEEEIQRLNREARGKDAVTDVLSFPMLELRPGMDPGDAAGPQDMENGRIYIGDMVICAPRARAQAVEYGHGDAREFGFLAAHSILHFLGYDHEDEAQREQMEALQRMIMKDAGLERP